MSTLSIAVSCWMTGVISFCLGCIWCGMRSNKNKEDKAEEVRCQATL